jgi:phosphopantetheinyl transferase
MVAVESTARVGVDVDVARSHDIASRVLRDAECDELAGLDDDDRGREVLLRFSAKEASTRRSIRSCGATSASRK